MSHLTVDMHNVQFTKKQVFTFNFYRLHIFHINEQYFVQLKSKHYNIESLVKIKMKKPGQMSQL